MNRATLVLYLAAASAACGCSAEDPLARPAGDAGTRDIKGSSTGDAKFVDRLDASGGSYADEASSPPPPPPPPDADLPPDAVAPPDAPSDRMLEDAPPSRPDVPLPDAPSLPDVVDAPLDVPVSGICLVTFSVTGVPWGDAGTVPGRAVRLVGDVSSLGAWMPANGVALAESALGTWSGQVMFRQLQRLEFKFVKLVPGLAPEWETWTPYDSNRSLLVDCGDGGAAASDAAADSPIGDTIADATRDASDDMLGADVASVDVVSDAAPSDASASDGLIVSTPAIGKSYSGTFGVRPADATK